MKQIETVGRFLQWSSAVSVDQTRKLLKILPEFRGGETVDIQCDDNPDDEQLESRVTSY